MAALYVGDYVSIKYKIPPGRQAFGSVQVEEFTAFRQKSGKTEFTDDGPDTEVCVNSLFPQLGYPPCWYASRKKQKMNKI